MNTSSVGRPRGRGRGVARWAVLGLLCAGLGLVTTVGVAWGLAVFADTNFKGPPEFGARWVRDATKGEGTGEIVLCVYQPMRGVTFVDSLAGMGHWTILATFEDVDLDLPRWIVLPWIEGELPWPGEGLDCWRETYAYGWPRRAMYYTGTRTFPAGAPAGMQTAYEYVGLLRVSSIWELERIGLPVQSFDLPGRPLWRGLILDTLFFAAAWFVLLFALARGRSVLRTRRRRKRGLCVKCGYDVKGLAEGSACPECGFVQECRGAPPSASPAPPPGEHTGGGA